MPPAAKSATKNQTKATTKSTGKSNNAACKGTKMVAAAMAGGAASETLARGQAAKNLHALSAPVEAVPERMKQMVAEAFSELVNPVKVWPEVPRELFIHDIRTLQRRLTARKRGLLTPGSKAMQRWDLVVIVALAITCVYTPFEVALLPTAINASFVVAQVVNAVFVADLVLTFFLPLQAADGSYITSHRKIALAYFKSWFLIDAIACCPFEIIGLVGVTSTAMLKPIKMLRLLRLLKLARIAKASRILARWEDHITLPYATRSLIGWSIVLALSIHWFSCMWVLLTQITGSQRNAALQAAVASEIESVGGVPGASSAACDVSPPALSSGGGPGTCVGLDAELCPSDCLSDCEMSVLAALEGVTPGFVAEQENWICRAIRSSRLSPGAYELAVRGPVYWSAILAIPYSSNGFITPSNTIERAVNFVLYFLSLVLWSMFTGAICGSIANIDPFVRAYRSSMDQLNVFLDDHDAPQPLRLRAREYLRSSRWLNKKNAAPELLAELSPQLKNDAISFCSSKVLLNVSWMGELEAECLGRLALFMEYRALARKEMLMDDGALLAVVSQGVAARGGSILTAGMHFGDDLLLTSPNLRSPKRVVALSYLELATLKRSTLDDVLSAFPESAKIVRVAACKLAMKRAGIIIHTANKEKKRAWQAEREGAAPPGGGGGAVATAAPTRPTRAAEPPLSGRLNQEEVDMLLTAMTGKKLREISPAAKDGSGQPRGIIEGDEDDESNLTERTSLVKDLSRRVASTEASIAALTTMMKEVHEHVVPKQQGFLGIWGGGGVGAAGGSSLDA